jgi:hypothetical protein
MGQNRLQHSKSIVNARLHILLGIYNFAILLLKSFVFHSISKKLRAEDDAEIFHRCRFKSRLGAILFKHRHLKRFLKSACRTRTGSQRDEIISEKAFSIRLY